MANLTIVKLKTVAEKATRTTLEGMFVTRDIITSWQHPPFQRPLRVNDKVKALAEEIKRNGGIIPGVLTLGVLSQTGVQVRYRLDGQHRMEAFLMSGLDEGYADVRIHFCESMGQMGEEYVELNSRLVSMRPDDILRGLEGSYANLRTVREKCRFVGYDMIRRNEKAPIVSMSAMLRVWRGSSGDVPVTTGGVSTPALAITLTNEETELLVSFLGVCSDAWGRDKEYARLWGSLNLILCAWLYRRMVITQYSPRTPRLTKELFGKCLMSLSADSHYVDWLLGRIASERDRAPAYDRIKRIFVTRLAKEMDGKKPAMPAPAWAYGRG